MQPSMRVHAYTYNVMLYPVITHKSHHRQKERTSLTLRLMTTLCRQLAPQSVELRLIVTLWKRSRNPHNVRYPRCFGSGHYTIRIFSWYMHVVRYPYIIGRNVPYHCGGTLHGYNHTHCAYMYAQAIHTTCRMYTCAT